MSPPVAVLAIALAASVTSCDRARPVVGGGGTLHGNAWMDVSSPAFHAYSANRGLAWCTPCHGPMLRGDGPTPGCGSCHGVDLPAGVASWETNCTMCHGGLADSTGAPPRGAWGSSADPARVGAHTAHVSGGLAAPFDCVACHPKPTDAFSAGHLDGQVAVTGYTGADPVMRAAVTDPGWDGGTAKCSTAYCHGATLSGGTLTQPTWTTVDGSQAACGTCHGLPPPTGAHASHVTTGAVSFDCVACHVKPSGGLSAGHVDGQVAVTGYTGTDAGLLAAVTDPGWNRGTARCASAYCHGATLSGGTLTQPTWTTVDGSQAACGTCHGVPPFAQPSPAHPVYIFAAPCVGCHPGTATWDDVAKTNGIVQGGGHVNAKVEFTFSGHPPGWASYSTGGAHAAAAPLGCPGCGIEMGEYYQCTSCHGKNGDFDQSGGTSRVSCGACHPAFFAADGSTSCSFCH